MLTNNYYNMVRMTMLNSPSTNSGQVNNIKITGGKYLYPSYISPYDARHWIAFNTSSSLSTGWSFGSGSTPTTVNDYQLDNYIQATSSTLNSNAVVTGYESDNEYGVRITLTFTNISNSPFTFREIGYCGEVKGSISAPASSISTYAALFYRNVFDSDITIQPTETKVLVIILKFPK